MFENVKTCIKSYKILLEQIYLLEGNRIYSVSHSNELTNLTTNS